MIKKFIKKFISTAHPNNYQPLNHIGVSRSKLINNFNLIHRQHTDMKLIPVLKANAYGHGLNQVATALNSADCEMLAVDGYFEAAKIRDITNHRILVMGYLKPSNYHLIDTKKCSFVVQSSTDLHTLAELNKPIHIHIELNTGMNRLGLQPDELDEYLVTLKKYPKIKLEGVMTHLADADNPKSDFTNGQVELFDTMVAQILSAGFRPRYVHIAQTAGSTKAASKYANAMRIGIGLYGINPLTPADKHFGDLEKLLPALELKSEIIKTVDLKKGDRVSYNGTFTADKPMRIGVLSLGYYEGVPRELSTRGFVTDGNQKMAIVGRVCMNHTMIDLTDSKLTAGDTVTVISNNPADPNSIANIAKSHRLFNYSLLTNLSSSVRRVLN
ncbi:MAG: alanine racemase [Candidatus Saccharibacteria bacterium]